MSENERPSAARRKFHHLTFYGFLLCFAATCVATVYHYAFGWEAPYASYDLPVLLGTLGGIGLLVGRPACSCWRAGAPPRSPIRATPAWTWPSSSCCC